MARKKKTPGSIESKTLILDAAVHEFGNSGFHGARIDIIAKRSGVNKAMIYYHFTNKEGLYKAIIERLMMQILEKINSIAQQNQTSEERITSIIETLSEFVGNFDDNLRKLILWEIASGGKTFSKTVGVTFLKKILPLIKIMYKDSEDKNHFRDEISPVFTQMTIVGSIIFANSIHMIMKKSILFNTLFGRSFKKDFTKNLLLIAKGGILKK